MRLWSLHPRYLDPAGLVALWREALLAQAVLRNLTKGYRHHPQLLRFRELYDPRGSIADYLHEVAKEADRRGYAFDHRRIGAKQASAQAIELTRGQLLFEWEHLMSKLRHRNPRWYESIGHLQRPRPHPSFAVISGAIEEWEKAPRSRA